MESEPTELPIIACQELTLRYGRSLMALDGFTASVAKGCHGLLGPNGAGKSTLIKVLLGLLRPNQGDGTVLGKSIQSERIEVRRHVGYMPERDAHVPGMHALDYVALMAQLSGLTRTMAIKRAHEMLHYVDLGDARYLSVDGFSAGMKQRAKLAAALVHDPDLVFLDEPTNGLDPKGRRQMLTLIQEIASAGISVLLSTHLLQDVQEVCSSVIVAQDGRVVRQGSVEALTRGLDRSFQVEVAGEIGTFAAGLIDRGAEVATTMNPVLFDVVIPEGSNSRIILETALQSGCRIRRLTPARRTLEDVFMESIGEGGAHANS